MFCDPKCRGVRKGISTYRVEVNVGSSLSKSGGKSLLSQNKLTIYSKVCCQTTLPTSTVLRVVVDVQRRFVRSTSLVTTLC